MLHTHTLLPLNVAAGDSSNVMGHLSASDLVPFNLTLIFFFFFLQNLVKQRRRDPNNPRNKTIGISQRCSDADAKVTFISGRNPLGQ